MRYISHSLICLQACFRPVLVGVRLSVAVAIALTMAPLCVAQTGRAADDRLTQIRHHMVAEIIEKEGITNEAVLNAMRAVPRHEFVAGTLKNRAYEDVALPIGSKQTISAPYIVAYMTETLDPQLTDRVLEIGTGSGYQAAVLAEIVKDVYSVEIVSPLARSAAERLEQLGYTNVHVRDGDGYQGWAEHAPFDKIIVTCSPEAVPQPLTDQLKEGGMMIVPVGERYQQAFYLLRKVDGKLEQQKLISTLFVPMTGQSEEERRIQPNPDYPMIVNGGFDNDSNEDGKVDGWHYQRQTTMSDDQPMQGSHLLRFENRTPGELSQALQGTAVNGRRIGALDWAVWARTESVVPGPQRSDRAAVVVHYYDALRRELGSQVIAVWRGSQNWQQAKKRIPVPVNAREMIIRIGLNGATGTLDLDALQMVPVPR
jgi:protein-L-isoaspartate(D-aspartate) O-methyltransferase